MISKAGIVRRRYVQDELNTAGGEENSQEKVDETMKGRELIPQVR